MGYCIEMNESTLTFNVDDKNKIIKKIKEGIKNKNIKTERWIDFPEILEAESIDEIFEALRFELYLDEENNMYRIDYFSGENLGGYEEELFNYIKDYMNDGYVEFLGEDGEKWRYWIKNHQFKEVYPKEIWDF